MGSLKWMTLGSVAGLALLAAVPLVVKSAYTLNLFVLALIWMMIVVGWDLITGYAGIFSFGQIAFFVIGAYASGMLAIGLSLSPWITMPLAGLITAGFAVAIALPCLRVRGAYVAVVTYALHLVLPTLIIVFAFLGTGGVGGLIAVPPLSIGSYIFSPLNMVPWYYVALALASISVFFVYFVILRSSFGLALTALRDAEDFAKSLGVNEDRTKLIVFALSGFFTGIAGGFYVHYTGSISQRTLGMDFFLLLMVMLMVGGMGRYPGAVLGALLFTFVNDYLRVADSIRLIILGLIIIVAILVMPEGFVGATEGLVRRFRRRRKPAEPGAGEQEAGVASEGRSDTEEEVALGAPSAAGTLPSGP
jgi:branched-chain amino acid transport system permease protein